MRRYGADHTGQRAVRGVDSHTLGAQDPRKDSADTAEIEVAFRRDIADHQADLIAVANDHQTGGAAFVENSCRVAVSVGMDFISELSGIIHPQTLTFGLEPGRGRGID